ncbi:hypothetical protein E8E11_008230 [Didymella keratinophila]|nr:hypothetical protein E8E11_008230 [Didymella keratinophila]
MFPYDVYESAPLDCNASEQIRVLEILDNGPSDGKIPIACALRTVNMCDIQYSALSYRWGASDKGAGILLNGHPFSIRKNLWEFLDEAQSSGYTERNHQVALMREIYSNAHKVMVWLGRKLAMNAAPTISRDWLREKARYPGLCRKPVLCVLQEIDRQLCEGMSTLADGCNTELQHLPHIGYMDGVLDGLEQLFLAEYWERIWIAQEYILAKKIELRVGPHSLCGDALSRLCKVTSKYLEGSIDDPGTDTARTFSENFERERRTPRINKVQRKLAFNIIRRRDRWRDCPITVNGMDPPSYDDMDCWSLEQLLRTFTRSKCSEPRDHIYALLSLVHSKDKEVFNIKPDYTTTASELLVELAYGFCKLLGSQQCEKVIRPVACALGLNEKDEIYMIDMILKKVDNDIDAGVRGRARDVMHSIKLRYFNEIDDYITRVDQEWKWFIASSRSDDMPESEVASPSSGTRTPAELDYEDSTSLSTPKALLSPTLDMVERFTEAFPLVQP